MTNGTNSISRRSDPLTRDLANIAIEFGTLASRFAEASRSVEGATQRECETILDALAKSLRAAGDGCHESARGLEKIVRHE